MKRKRKTYKWLCLLLILRLLCVDRALTDWVKSLPFVKKQSVLLMVDGLKHRIGGFIK